MADGFEGRRHPDGAGIVLAHALNAVLDAAHGQEQAVEPPTHDAAGDPIVGPHPRPALATGRSSPSVRSAKTMTGPRNCARCSRAFAPTASRSTVLRSTMIRPATIVFGDPRAEFRLWRGVISGAANAR